MSRSPESSWIYRSYRSFCNIIYGPFAIFYNLTSYVVSLGQWNKWRRLSLDFVKGENVLELGFGTGALQLDLIEAGYRVYGLEYSRDMHRITNTCLGDLKDKSTRVVADGMKIPFANESVENIIATFPEQYIVDEKTLKECFRILKSDGGRLIIVGRWIELKSKLLQMLFPVFYSKTPESEVEKLRAKMKHVGLDMKVMVRPMGFVTHKVIVAEKVT